MVTSFNLLKLLIKTDTTDIKRILIISLVSTAKDIRQAFSIYPVLGSRTSTNSLTPTRIKMLDIFAISAPSEKCMLLATWSKEKLTFSYLSIYCDHNPSARRIKLHVRPFKVFRRFLAKLCWPSGMQPVASKCHALSSTR